MLLNLEITVTETTGITMYDDALCKYLWRHIESLLEWKKY